MASLTVVKEAISSLEYSPCFVCFKNVFRHHQSSQESNSKLLKLFITLLKRMSLSPIILPKEFGLCNDCAVIVESGTKLFHQIQCLQLQLDWNLDKVMNIMVLADMMPSRMKDFQEMYKLEGMTTEDMKQVRCAIKNKLKGHRAHSRSVPKVVLHDYFRTISSSAKVPVNMPNNILKTIKIKYFTKTKSDEQIVEKKLLQTFENQMQSSKLYFSLGWILSFITVGSLCASYSVGVNVKAGMTEANPCDDDETANDSCCSMEVDDVVEEVPTENAEEDASQGLTESAFTAPEEPIPEELTKLNATLLTLMLPVLSDTNVKDFEAEILEKNNQEIDTNTSNKPKNLVSGSNQTFECGRRSLRLQYKCASCSMKFSTELRLEAHKKNCHTEMEVDNDSTSNTDTDGDDSGREKNIQKDEPWHKTEINESSSEDECAPPSPLPSDDEGETITKMADIKSFEINGAFECLSCKNTFQMNGVKDEQFKQLHNAYLHSNGQTVLEAKTLELLQITGADVKLDSTKFTMQTCSFPECRSSIFADHDSVEYHKRLHGDFKCDVCEFECKFAIQLAIHEMNHNSKTHGERSYPCPKCPFKTTAGYKYYNHFLETHLNLKTQQAKCGICSKTFPELTVPLHHFVNEHDLNRLDDMEKGFKCIEDKDACHAYFLTNIQLQAHIQRIHKVGKRKRASALLKCLKCSKTFSFKNSLKNHQLLKCSDYKMDVISTKYTSDGVRICHLVNSKNATYICSVEGCEESFFTEEDLSKHSKLHGKFSCTLCPVEKTYAPDLSLHALEHRTQVKSSSNIQRYSCCLCEFQSSLKLRYIEHYLEIHMGLSADIDKCPICRYSFYSSRKELKRSFVVHYSSVHDLTLLKSGESSATCDMCSAYFLNEMQLSSHIDKIHGRSNNINKTCLDCGKKFKEHKALINHRKNRHFVNEDKFQYTCSVEGCGKKFEFKLGLTGHVVSCHNLDYGGTFNCQTCARVFTRKSSYEQHLKNHKKVKRGPRIPTPVVCEQCGKSFKYKHFLELHKLRHVGPDGWEFVCEICSRRFARKENLAQHMRTHTKEKPFVCEVCGEKYAHKHNWKSHMNSKHNANLPTIQRDTTNMKSTRKGKKLPKYAPVPDSSEPD